MSTEMFKAPVDEDIFALRESQAHSCCRSFPEVLATAVGSRVYDGAGREYIDFLAGAGSLNYGHNDPDMKVAQIEYITGDGFAHDVIKLMAPITTDEPSLEADLEILRIAITTHHLAHTTTPSTEAAGQGS